MKNLSALICSFFAVLFFSAAAHAAPVQYQITAFHLLENSRATPDPRGEYTPVNPDDYLFAGGTQITATFFYDSAAPVAGSLYAPPFPPLPVYEAGSGLSIAIAGVSAPIGTGNLSTLVLDDATTPNDQDHLLFSSNIYPRPLTVEEFQLYQIRIVMSGPTDMLSSQLLPESLVGLNTSGSVILLDFHNSSGNVQTAIFEGESVSQVPLPGAALFFLSGLIGLSTNIFRKANK